MAAILTCEWIEHVLKLKIELALSSICYKRKLNGNRRKLVKSSSKWKNFGLNFWQTLQTYVW